MERGRFYQQSGERSGSGQAGSRDVQPARRVPQEQSWYEQDIPHEQLVATLRQFLEKERAQAAKEGYSFNPFLYLHLKLNDAVNANYQIRESPSAEYLFFEGLRDAWDALSYNHYPEGGNKQMIERCLHHYLDGTHIAWRGNKPFFVLEDNKQVTLLDAMAEAVNIPHQRGQRFISAPPSISYSYSEKH